MLRAHKDLKFPGPHLSQAASAQGRLAAEQENNAAAKQALAQLHKELASQRAELDQQVNNLL